MWDSMCAEYAQALRHFPPHSLKIAVSWMLCNRREKFWPIPAEIAEAVQEAVDADRLARMPRLATTNAGSDAPRFQPWEPEIVFSHRVGQRALHENVGAQLLDNLNLQKAGKIDKEDPAYGRFHSLESADIEWLISERQKSYDVLRGIKAEPFNGAQALVNIFQAMLDREERLRNEHMRRAA